MKTREEHMEESKREALKLADPVDQFKDFYLRLREHPETANHSMMGIGMSLLLGKQLDAPEKMRKFIEDFN